MYKKIFFMENLIKHLAPIPRRFNCSRFAPAPACALYADGKK